MLKKTTQLNSGIEPTLDKDNDKNTVVIALREIAEENIKVPDLTESAIYKLRKHVEQVDDSAETDDEVGDDFESLYKGEISKVVRQYYHQKSKKIRKKIQVSKEDIEELTETKDISVQSENEEQTDDTDVSLEELSDTENQDTGDTTDDPNNTNS